MRLSEYLDPDLVLVGLDATAAQDAFHQIARHLIAQRAVGPASTVEREFASREERHTTVLGDGVAIPHTTLEGLRAPILLVALASDPFQFGPPDTGPVGVLFVLLSPVGRGSEHIKLLARICRLVKHPGFIDELVASETTHEAVAVIERVDGLHV